jgi:hypothetical protein
MTNNFSLFPSLFGLAIAAAIGFWVATDAKKRGMNGVLWGVAVFLVCIVFLPIYLIVRKPLLPEATGLPYPPTSPIPPQQYVPPPPQNATPPPPIPPAPSTTPQPGHNFCLNCGAKLAPDAKFCGACGHSA